ncbi:hypothetical protein ACVV2G_23605 [Streptomyces ziwulingensis]
MQDEEERENDRHHGSAPQVPVVLLAGVDDDPAESHIVRGID